MRKHFYAFQLKCYKVKNTDWVEVSRKNLNVFSTNFVSIPDFYDEITKVDEHSYQGSLVLFVSML